MTPKKTARPADDDSLGVLDDAASLDTTGIGILGETAQVSVTIPQDEDDDLADEGVVEGEILSELIVDEAPVRDAAAIGRIQEDTADIVIEVPAEEYPADAVPDGDSGPVDGEPTPITAEVVVEEVVAAAPKKKKPAAARKAAAPRAAKPADAGRTEPAVAEAPAPEVPATAAPEPAGDEAPSSSEPAGDPSADVSAAIPPAPAAAPAETANPEKASVPTVTPEEKPAPTEAEKALAPRPASAPARAEVTLSSKRIGEQRGEAARESADLLTADRLLDPNQRTRPEPEGAWSHFLYTISGRRINIGDGKRARARKELSARIAAPLAGGARFVPVLSRKGGVGKTTITALLGMALADAREDRVIAVDANPDRGTLAQRIERSNGKSVRDLVRIHGEVRGYHDLSAIVGRDATRLDVLASDADPRIAEAFGDSDYRDVAGVAAHYYSLVLTDTGTGIVHSVMTATLDLADQLVIISGLSVDEARLASETLTWLETNGHAELAREAIVVLNQSTPGSPLVRLNELEAHFATRARHVVRMPYDSQIAGGGAIVFANLQPETRLAARELAALLVEGLRTRTA